MPRARGYAAGKRSTRRRKLELLPTGPPMSLITLLIVEVPEAEKEQVTMWSISIPSPAGASIALSMSKELSYCTR